jgi:gamma-glutamyltranspeptidase/glutathione hydrolase
MLRQIQNPWRKPNRQKHYTRNRIRLRSMTARGIIAAGHELTVQAAEAMLRAGGNAFDAVLAAHFAACVAEPVLASLGGGGFLLACKPHAKPLIYDFFTHTPQHKRPVHELDFRPIVADFGTAQQEFHIGQGTIATPGSVKGVFEIHHDLCSMPLREIVAPAVQFAREGVRLNSLQAYIFNIVSPIYSATPETRQIYCSLDSGDRLVGEGEIIRQPELADTLEILAIEGVDLFYRGEIAQAIVRSCVQGGGHLTLNDLGQYDVMRRAPLVLIYRGAQVLTNPPPSSGGLLIAFGLELLKNVKPGLSEFGSAAHLITLAQVMALTNKARAQVLDRFDDVEKASDLLLSTAHLKPYFAAVANHMQRMRGTTHMSVMDARGNLASMTVSNGEGCGSIVSSTGIMLNNMLGEQDLSPQGFHLWQENQRISSMMAPTMVQYPDGSQLATGSGGSNRIRTALLQVLVNLLDFGMPVEQAVRSPRIHLEGEKLSVEGGFQSREVEQLVALYAEHEVWYDLNLFFGGVHTVTNDAGGFIGEGDPRRGGVCRVVV